MKVEQIWKFQDDIDTDQIIPSQYLLMPTIEEMKKHTFETVHKDFAACVKEGDIIVAGENFGCGSSREQAPKVLKALGIKAIVVKSVARIFFRNAINIGLPVILCESLYDEIDKVKVTHIDLLNGIIETQQKQYKCTKLPEHMQMILDEGGLIAYLNKEGV